RFYAGTNGTSFLNPNGFLTEVASNDSSLVYSTYLGGTNYDVATGVAVDPNKNVYVCGYSASFNFPTWNTPANLRTGRYLNGITNNAIAASTFTFDSFVTKFPALNGTISPVTQTNQFYSTFLGGTNSDMAYGIAADTAGNAYITGWTASTNFPVVNSPPGLSWFLSTNGNLAPVATNVFLTKIAPDGSLVLNSTEFGGNLVDVGYKVAVDAGGDAFVVGTETSFTNFPTKNAFGSLLATNSSGTGAHDAFVTAISADWSNVLYSVCIGGNRDTFGYGIALDSSSDAFITGSTDSTNYPNVNAAQFWFNGTNFINGTNSINGTRFSGTNDAFLTEIAFTPTVLTVSGIEPAGQTNGMGVTVTFGVTASGANGQVLYQWQRNGTNLVNGGRLRGANSPTLTITNSQPGDSSTNYGLTISYPGTIVSPDATNLDSLTESGIDLTVSEQPVITLLPTNQTVFAGTDVSFSVIASGAPLLYEWVFADKMILTNNSQISGATNDTLMISDVQTNNGGAYRLFVYYNTTNYFVTNVTLTVVEPLSIVTAPTNQTVAAGSTASFSVVANGFPLSYQWSNSVAGALTNGANIGGATSNTLTITNVQASDAGTYTVFVSNDLQSTNLSAVLSLTPPPAASFTGFAPAAGSLGSAIVFSGSGGPTNGTYYVLTSSNLVTPVTNWISIATNQFDGQGQFIFTNPVSTNASSQFFILKQP
ncbi:MAG TPA: SBBP repeat-containing protein, partial [Verrucomicrobiae bacterium]|nr:SBBP repeat-containing protein [Verrucomicrobiae bacterium]